MVYDLRSKRIKRLSGNQSDVFQYDDFPKAFKVQVTYLWDVSLGLGGETFAVIEAYATFVQTLKVEYGVFNWQR